MSVCNLFKTYQPILLTTERGTKWNEAILNFNITQDFAIYLADKIRLTSFLRAKLQSQ